MRSFAVKIFFRNLFISSIATLLAYGSFAQQKNPNQNDRLQSDRSFYSSQKITYKSINTSNYRYGYDIFINNALVIHQQVIPSRTGNKGFRTKSDATKVAILVIEKIRKGMFPPTVTISEMQKLAIDLR